MSVQVTKEFEGLAPGQIWKTDHGYILITDAGGRLASYKKLRDPTQTAVATNLIRLEALVAYLKNVRAEVVRTVDPRLVSREE